MDEHLAAWQIAEFTLGCLDEDELEEVYRHFDECGECVSWLAGGCSRRGLRVKAKRQRRGARVPYTGPAAVVR